MKTQITPLHEKATAKLPNRTAETLAISKLPPLAVKLLLYLIYLWNQEQRKKTYAKGQEVQLATSFQKLAAHLTPNTLGAVRGQDYRELKNAISAVMTAHLYKAPAVGVHHWVSLLSETEFDEETGALFFRLPSSFRTGLEILELEGFTLVPLADALALDDTRHLRMLMWACTFQHLTSDGGREVGVDLIRLGLGLKGESYDDWRIVWTKLKQYASAVSKRTSYDITMLPVKDGRRVVAVRFDVLRRKAKR